MVIHVAVAVIEDDRGRVLLSQRKEGTHQGGLWEFPGGKLEPGETLSQALGREVYEELGIAVVSHEPLIKVPHQYGDRAVVLDVHRVTHFDGQPLGMEGQPLVWVKPEDISDYPLPAADRPIVTALSLPSTYLITGEGALQPERFLARLSAALEQSRKLVQLRAQGLDENAYRQLALSAVSLCDNHGARLLLNAPPEWVVTAGAAGVHLNSGLLMALKERPLPEGYLVAASCHCLEELQQAERIGADFVVLSPVMMTASHPEAEPMGWERFSEMVEGVSMPVFALGGMELGMIQQARQAGGQGIAAIREFWPVV
ncbi:MAG: Nudix family hydrolase [Candidatus Sedimenticola sp. (ex Thyasira tokunagai)]